VRILAVKRDCTKSNVFRHGAECIEMV
jgi:hypothetical protein